MDFDKDFLRLLKKKEEDEVLAFKLDIGYELNDFKYENRISFITGLNCIKATFMGKSRIDGWPLFRINKFSARLITNVFDGNTFVTSDYLDQSFYTSKIPSLIAPLEHIRNPN